MYAVVRAVYTTRYNIMFDGINIYVGTYDLPNAVFCLHKYIKIFIISNIRQEVSHRQTNNNLNNKLHLDPIMHTATWCDGIISSPSGRTPSGRIIISLDAAAVWRKIRVCKSNLISLHRASSV